jgi:hypothetical protein
MVVTVMPCKGGDGNNGFTVGVGADDLLEEGWMNISGTYWANQHGATALDGFPNIILE